MACEVNNKEINSQCAELLVRPTYILLYILYKHFTAIKLRYKHVPIEMISFTKKAKLFMPVTHY